MQRPFKFFFNDRDIPEEITIDVIGDMVDGWAPQSMWVIAEVPEIRVPCFDVDTPLEAIDMKKRYFDRKELHTAEGGLVGYAFVEHDSPHALKSLRTWLDHISPPATERAVAP